MLFYWRGNREVGEIKACVDSIAGYLWVLAHLAFSLKASVSIKLAKENVWNILLHTVHIRDGSSDLEAIKAPLVLSVTSYDYQQVLPCLVTISCLQKEMLLLNFCISLSCHLKFPKWRRFPPVLPFQLPQTGFPLPKTCFSRIPFSQFAYLSLFSVF